MNSRHGLLMIHTGDGKGKTSAALGLALRAAGAGLRVSILQFIKNAPAGEHRALALLPGAPIEILPLGSGFVLTSPPPPKAVDAARHALDLARTRLTSRRFDLVILDEIFPALAAGLLAEADLLQLADLRPPDVHLLLTGRGAPPSLIDRADLVTEMRSIKHPHDRGIPAQEGIEF